MLDDFTAASRVGARRGGQSRREIARGQRVHLDVVLGQVVAVRPGEADDPGFGGGIRRGTRSAEIGEEGGDVDDLAATLGAHLYAGVSGHLEGGGEIDGDHRVPVSSIKLLGRRAEADARRVDENVEPAEPLDTVLDGICAGAALGQVGAQEDVTPPAVGDQALRRAVVVGLAGHHHVGAGPCERNTEGPPQP